MQRRLGLGIFLILLGLLLLGATLGYLAWDWARLWPLVFVFLGLLDLADHGWRGLREGGGFLLLLTTGRLDGDWRRYWPVLMILAGLAAMVRGERPGSRREEEPPDPWNDEPEQRSERSE